METPVIPAPMMTMSAEAGSCCVVLCWRRKGVGSECQNDAEGWGHGSFACGVFWFLSPWCFDEFEGGVCVFMVVEVLTPF